MYRVHTSPSPPAPPITTYTPFCRYFTPAPVFKLSTRAYPCAYHSPCRCANPSPALPPTIDRHSSAFTASKLSTSSKLNSHCGYSLAALPTSPITPACAGLTSSFLFTRCVLLVISVQFSSFSQYPSPSSAFI